MVGEQSYRIVSTTANLSADLRPLLTREQLEAQGWRFFDPSASDDWPVIEPSLIEWQVVKRFSR